MSADRDHPGSSALDRFRHVCVLYRGADDIVSHRQATVACTYPFFVPPAKLLREIQQRQAGPAAVPRARGSCP